VPDQNEIAVPEGYKLMPGKDQFMAVNGPVFRRQDEEGNWHYAFTAEDRHCNGNDVIHGGMLFSFADHFLGFSVAMAARRMSTTISMNVNYVAPGKIGDFIEGEAKITRLTRTLAFAQAHVHVGPRALMTADGVFKLLGDGF